MVANAKFYVKVGIFLLYLSFCYANIDTNYAKDKAVALQTFQPQQFYDWSHMKRKTSIETSIKEAPGHHHSDAFYEIEFDVVKYHLDLSLNKDLLPSSFGITDFHEDGSLQMYHPSDQERNHCYYHGSVRGFRDSQVMLSTCDGLSGVVMMGGDILVITPVDETSDSNLSHSPDNHIIYRLVNNPEATGTCGNEDHSHSHNVLSIVDSLFKGSNETQHSRHKRDTGEKKFVELMVVADNAMTKKYTAIELDKKIKELVNYLDGFYSKLGIRVVLSHIEKWTNGDKIPFKTSAKDVLNEFLGYRQSKIKSDSEASPWVYADNIQFLYGGSFDGSTIGMATVGTMCGSRSGGVNEDKSNVLSVAATFAHEMGHNFGMNHDTPGCECPANTHCIMAASAGGHPEKDWSSCSKEYLNKGLNLGLGNCLLNVPPPNRIYGGPKCGNDIVETGEQCDCGLPEDCTSKCCNATTCLLYENAECDAGVCCESCKYSRAGQSCRGTKGNPCDLPEFCTGHSPYCPGNVYNENGHLCSNGNAMCVEGVCLTYDLQCQNIWGTGATNSDDICYNVINKKGNVIGNCGNGNNGTFIRCSDMDIMCGKLQCQGGESSPMVNSNKVNWNNRLEFGGVTYSCKTTSSAATDVEDAGLVKDGTLCGKNKVCAEGQCKDVPPLTCSRTCTGHGVCNNLGHCHCESGWAPPYCNKEGTGGSIDSGPINDGLADKQMILMIVMFVVVLPLILGVGTFLWYKYCGGRAYIQTLRKNRERRQNTIKQNKQSKKNSIYRQVDSNLPVEEQRLEAVRRNKLQSHGKNSGGGKTASKTNLIDQPLPLATAPAQSREEGWTTDPTTVAPYSWDKQPKQNSFDQNYHQTDDQWENGNSYPQSYTAVEYRPQISTPSRPPPPKVAPPSQLPPPRPTISAPVRPQSTPQRAPLGPPPAPPAHPVTAKPPQVPMGKPQVPSAPYTAPARAAPVPPQAKPKPALPPSIAKKPHHGSIPILPTHPKPTFTQTRAPRPQSSGTFSDTDPSSPDAANLSVMEKARLFGQQ